MTKYTLICWYLNERGRNGGEFTLSIDVLYHGYTIASMVTKLTTVCCKYQACLDFVKRLCDEYAFVNSVTSA